MSGGELRTSAERVFYSDEGISVVVPVYNSESTLNELVARLEAVLSQLTPHFEVIQINDGSRDRSWEVVKELSATSSWVRGINLMRNYGQHDALLTGIASRNDAEAKA